MTETPKYAVWYKDNDIKGFVTAKEACDFAKEYFKETGESALLMTIIVGIAAEAA